MVPNCTARFPLRDGPVARPRWTLVSRMWTSNPGTTSGTDREHQRHFRDEEVEPDRSWPKPHLARKIRIWSSVFRDHIVQIAFGQK